MKPTDSQRAEAYHDAVLLARLVGEESDKSSLDLFQGVILDRGLPGALRWLAGYIEEMEAQSK